MSTENPYKGPHVRRAWNKGDANGYIRGFIRGNTTGKAEQAEMVDELRDALQSSVSAYARQAEIVSELVELLRKATVYTFLNPVLDNKIKAAIAKAIGGD